MYLRGTALSDVYLLFHRIFRYSSCFKSDRLKVKVCLYFEFIARALNNPPRFCSEELREMNVVSIVKLLKNWQWRIQCESVSRY